MTFGETLERHRGIGPGFDFLRIGLATTIVMTHACLLSNNEWLVRDTPLWFNEYALVPMFFALSGFLVAASGVRLSLGNFLINRGLRIVPALAVDVVFCALLLGPLVTTVSLGEYFTHHDFFRYFLNVTGRIHYRLPGVFEGNPSYRVNGALWTVPYEIGCYAILAGAMLLRLLKRPAAIAALIAIMLAAGLALDVTGFTKRHGAVGGLLEFYLVARGAGLLLAFLMGVFAYQIRALIPFNRGILLACVAACVAAVFVLDGSSVNHVANRILLYPALVYITVYLGLTPIPIPKFFHSGDYSYGIYLYHDPLLQTVILLFPGLALMHGWGALFVFLAGAPFVMLMAFSSWHLIEKRVLRLRKRFSFVAKVRDLGQQVPEPASSSALDRPTRSAPEAEGRKGDSGIDDIVRPAPATGSAS
jgi:peptidoglycan/LPS O-acetylase OafA/YrhL